MTTCKHCGLRITLFATTPKASWIDDEGFPSCPYDPKERPLKYHEPAATEGTPASPPTDQAACGADVNGVARTQPCELQAPKPRLKYLQPEQYLSWLKKVDDGDWVNHRYRDAKDNAMASAIRELRDARAEIANLRSQLENAGMRISAMWEAIGLSPFSSRNELTKIKKALADAERKGWNDAIEGAARKAESGQTPLGPKRIRALSREPGVSRTPKGEEG